MITDETQRLREAIRQGVYNGDKPEARAEYTQIIAEIYKLERAAEAAAGEGAMPVHIPAAQ